MMRVRQRVQLRQRQVARRVHQRRVALGHRRTRVHARSRRCGVLVAVLQKQQQLHLVGLLRSRRQSYGVDLLVEVERVGLVEVVAVVRADGLQQVVEDHETCR